MCQTTTVQPGRAIGQHPQTPQGGSPPHIPHRPIQVLRPASSRRAGFLVTPARSRCPPNPTQSLPLKPTPPSRSKNTRSRRLAHGASTIDQSSTDRMRPPHILLCHRSVPASAPCPSSCSCHPCVRARRVRCVLPLDLQHPANPRPKNPPRNSAQLLRHGGGGNKGLCLQTPPRRTLNVGH